MATSRPDILQPVRIEQASLSIALKVRLWQRMRAWQTLKQETSLVRSMSLGWYATSAVKLAEVIVNHDCVGVQKAQAAQIKRQAGHKRKLAGVNQQAASVIAETDAKVKRVRKKAGKMNSLAKILQPFTKERSSPSA